MEFILCLLKVNEDFLMILDVLITCVLMVPFLDSMFKVQTLTIQQLMIVYGLALANLPIIQVIKWIRNRK